MIPLNSVQPKEDDLKFKVMTYNILAQICIRKDIFSYCTSVRIYGSFNFVAILFLYFCCRTVNYLYLFKDTLKWTKRGNKLKDEILSHAADIICIQVLTKIIPPSNYKITMLRKWIVITIQ